MMATGTAGISLENVAIQHGLLHLCRGPHKKVLQHGQKWTEQICHLALYAL